MGDVFVITAGAQGDTFGWASDNIEAYGVTAGWFKMDGQGITPIAHDAGIQTLELNASIGADGVNTDVTGWNGVFVGAVTSEGGSSLTPFTDNQTITGIVVDPNARPTGYEDTTTYPTVVDAMNAWFATLGLSAGDDTDLINRNDYITAMNEGGNYSLIVLNQLLEPQTSEMELFEFVFIGAETGGMQPGWWAVYTNNDEEMDVRPLTSQTTMTLAQTLSDVSPEAGLDAINGTVLGVIEA